MRPIELARHRKAHGHAKPPTPSESGDWFYSALLLLSCLLDFIEGVSELVSEQGERRLSALRYELKRKLGGHSPMDLTSREEVDWLGFVVFATLDAFLQRMDHGMAAASITTLHATNVLGSRFLGIGA